MPADALSVLIDSSILIKGQRDPGWFESIVGDKDDLATCDAAAGEFEATLLCAARKKDARASA
jgi:hypothetical protein